MQRRVDFARLEVARPANDARRTDAAFVHLRLVTAEGPVVVAHLDAGILAGVRAALVVAGRMSAVVAEENHQRAVADLLAIQFGQHLADRVIHVRSTRRPQPLAGIGQVGVHLLPWFRFVDRHVNRRKRDIQEERLLIPLLQPLDGFARDQVGDVPLLLDQHAVAMPRAGEFTGLVAVIVGPAAAGQRTVAVVEAESLRSPFGAEPRCHLPVIAVW